ncbi:MAG: YnbE family lipoprotein [Alphaproteobacteria bacterium]|nr:YnbE family lipoprotein [Alphaproteobacteria bacterium]
MYKAFFVGLGASAFLIGCSPTVKVEAPDKPIVVNMNLKIDHKVKVKVQDDLKKSRKNKPDIFA